MKWQTEHVVDAPLDRVETVVLDPETLAKVPAFMKALEWVRPIEHRREGNVVVRVTRYRPTVRPPSFARGLDPDMTEWVERSRWNLATHVCEYEIEPNVPSEWRKYFASRGVYRLEARGAGRTARIVEGSIEIRVPLVGTVAERFVVAQLRKQFDDEARLIASRV